MITLALIHLPKNLNQEAQIGSALKTKSRFRVSYPSLRLVKHIIFYKELVDNGIKEPSVDNAQYDLLQDFLDARGWDYDAVSPNMAFKVSLPGRMTTDQVNPDTEFRGVNLYELGKHPNIDRLLDIVKTKKTLRMEITQK